MRRDRTVGRLLTRAFALLVALIVGSGLAEMAIVLLQHRVVRELSAHVQPLELANAHLRGVLGDAQRSLRGYLLTGDAQLLDSFYAARGEYYLARISIRGFAAARETAAVETQLAGAAAWWGHAERQRQAPPRSAAAAAFVEQGRPLFQAFVDANRALDADLARRAAVLQQRSSRLGGATVLVVATLTLAVALTAALSALVVARRITRPLGDLVAVLHGRRAGHHALRADPAAGPAEIRAVASAVNHLADEGDRLRDADRDIARLRTRVRELGYRIRNHLNVDDAVAEAVQGLATTMRADHVLIRIAADQHGVPPLASLHDEHLDGVLRPLAACETTWLKSGEVWATDDPAPVGDVEPPEEERRAWAAVGDGHVLTVALSDAEQCIGALTLIRDEGPPWSQVDIRLTEVVAADLGRGVHHAQLFEQEKRLVARLQELDDAKTDFMSTVSHELRTPLTSISGYVELLLDAEAGELEPPQARMLEVIGRNSRRLRELIEDMLILSKIESGAFRTTKRPVDLAALVDHAVDAIAPAATKAELRLHTDIRGPLELPADPDQLDRVVMNLLSNAVKFTQPQGTVTITGRREGEGVVLTVADTGMGIPHGELQALFTRFFRASNAIHQAIPGTGLGLAIIRTIIDNHDGDIEVSSTEGAGTTFTVRLPAG